MSTLSSVRVALANNAAIQVVSSFDTVHFPSAWNGWSHTVNILVAPTRGIYAADELQACMLGLTPGIHPTAVDHYHDWDTKLELGKLYFDEVIGHEATTRKLTLLETDFLPPQTVDAKGNAVIKDTRKLMRRTWVRLYPDIELAMHHDRYQYDIPRRDLNEFIARGRALGFVGRIKKAVTG